MSDKVQTLGEKRVKIDFNTTNNTMVDKIKIKTAELIDLCEELKANGGDERLRALNLAQDGFEGAGHWAVKANFID